MSEFQIRMQLGGRKRTDGMETSDGLFSKWKSTLPSL